jgi:hypothetical protein
VSLLTHATAGIVGGLIALLAADTISSKIGLPPSEASLQGRALQTRLAQVEEHMRSAKATPAGVDPQLAQKLAAAERRIAELDKAGVEIAALKDAQAKLAADAQAMAGKVAKIADPNAAPTDATSRLAKLEDTLTLLSTAAGTDPQRGRIPQLAAVSGKVADLEVALQSGLAGVRKGVTQEIDTRLGALTEAAETAKSGVLRIDRDVTQLKGDGTRTVQRLDQLKAAADQLEQTLAALKGDIDTQLKTVAKASDVTGAVAPVASKVAALETTVKGVVQSEQDRKADAERVVLSLQLATLRRALERGAPFAAELAEVQRVSAGRFDLKALDQFKAAGLPTLADLARDFRGLAHSIIEADRVPADSSVVDRLVAGAKSIVRVRKTDAAAEEKSSEAVVARIETALKSGQLATVMDEAKKLSPQALAPAKTWLDRIAARATVDAAITAVDDQLKSSLGGQSTPKKAE